MSLGSYTDNHPGWRVGKEEMMSISLLYLGVGQEMVTGVVVV